MRHSLTLGKGVRILLFLIEAALTVFVFWNRVPMQNFEAGILFFLLILISIFFYRACVTKPNVKESQDSERFLGLGMGIGINLLAAVSALGFIMNSPTQQTVKFVVLGWVVVNILSGFLFRFFTRSR